MFVEHNWLYRTFVDPNDGFNKWADNWMQPHVIEPWARGEESFPGEKYVPVLGAFGAATRAYAQDDFVGGTLNLGMAVVDITGVPVVGKVITQIGTKIGSKVLPVLKTGASKLFCETLQILCFAEGTPLLTPDGSKAIEKFKPGDWILSAPENDLEATPEPKQVEEVYTNRMALLNIHVAGQIIQTTEGHPFYVRDLGWTKACNVEIGDLLRSHDGSWIAVEDLCDAGEEKAVYNVKIADYHTYFVGSENWGFSVWSHNGPCRSMAERGAFLTQLATTGNVPKWMLPWLTNGRVPPGYNVDHILPLSVGGADLASNMRLLLQADHKLWHIFYHPWR